MDVKERLIEFIKTQNLSVASFERAAGLSNGYIASMRKGFGSGKLEDILRTYPQLSREWLLFGEGEMLKEGATQSVGSACNSNVLVGNHNRNIEQNSSAIISKALDEIAAQRALTERSQKLVEDLTAQNNALTTQLLSLIQSKV